MSNITKHTGDNNGGLSELLYAFIEDIESIDEATDKVITGQVHFLPDKGFHSIYFSAESGQFKDKLVETANGNFYPVTIPCFVPKDRPELLSAVSKLDERLCIVLAKDRNGYRRLAGTLEEPLRFRADYDSKENFSGLNGYKFEFYGDLTERAPFYGSVPETVVDDVVGGTPAGTSQQYIRGDKTLGNFAADARASISSSIPAIVYNPATGVLSLHVDYIIPTAIKAGQWDTAYGWGNHATAGYALTSSLGTMAYQSKLSVDIDGGTIDGATIGATSPASARVTSLTNTGLTAWQIMFPDTNKLITGSSNFTWTNTSNKLFVGGNISITVNTEPTTRKAYLLVGRENTNRHGGIIGGGTGYTVDNTESKYLFNSESGYKNPGIVGLSDNNLDIPSIGTLGSAGVVGIAGGATGSRYHTGMYGHAYFNTTLGGGSNNKVHGGYFTSRITSAVTDFNGEAYGVFAKADISAGTATGGSVYGGRFEAVGKTNATAYGGYFSATGGTTNYGIYAVGTSMFAASSGNNVVRVSIGSTSSQIALGSSGGAYLTFNGYATPQTSGLTAGSIEVQGTAGSSDAGQFMLIGSRAATAVSTYIGYSWGFGWGTQYWDGTASRYSVMMSFARRYSSTHNDIAVQIGYGNYSSGAGRIVAETPAIVSSFFFKADGTFLIGTDTKVGTEKLRVNGTSYFDSHITTLGYVKFGNYTTADRNLLTASAGMVVFNTDVSKFQGYGGTNWVDFH